jgi:hypothetical protein
MNRRLTKFMSECLCSGKVGAEVNDYAAALGDELAYGGCPNTARAPRHEYGLAGQVNHLF